MTSTWVLQIQDQEPEIFATEEAARERLQDEVREYEEAGSVEYQAMTWGGNMGWEERVECSGVRYSLVEWPEGAAEPDILYEWREGRIARLELRVMDLSREVSRLDDYVERLEGRLLEKIDGKPRPNWPHIEPDELERDPFVD